MIGLLGGLAAALCFGVGDFMVQSLTHERGWLPAVLGVQIVSAITLILTALAWHGPLAVAEVDWIVLALGSVNTLAIIALYRAFEVGKLSLVSPIAGSMGAFTLMFAWIAGLQPPAIVLPGLAAVLVGIVLSSLAQGHTSAASPAKLQRSLGVGWALLSALGFGWVFFRLADLADAVGTAWSIVGLRLVAIVLLVPLARVMRTSLAPDSSKPRPSRARLLAVAVLDGAGLIALALGSLHGSVAIAAVLASAFPVVTILLARVRLHERLAWWQWIGVAAILFGVIWISAWRT